MAERPLDEGPRFIYLGTGETAGVRVDEDSAMRQAAVYACVRVISQSIASLPWHLWKRRPDYRGADIAYDDELEYLLQVKPNPEMTPYTFKELLIAHATTWGNGYAEIERDQLGRPVWLWPITPDRVRPDRYPNGQLYYEVMNWGRPPSALKPENIIHVKGLGFDGMVGYSVVRMFARTIGIGAAAERFSAKMWANGAKPGGLLKHPGKLSDPAKEGLRKTWQQTYGGADNSGKVAILEEGLDYQVIEIPPEDAQFIQQRQFTVVEICRIFGVPPHKVAELSRSTFNNIEQQEIEFVRDTLTPWACRLEEESDVKLLGPTRVLRYFTRLDFRERLRGDTKARAEYVRTLVQGSVMKPNEGREAEDLNPVEGGDELLAQVAMTTLKRVVEGEPIPEPPAANPVTGTEQPPESSDEPAKMSSKLKATDLVERWTLDVAERCLRRETNRIADLNRGDKPPAVRAAQIEAFNKSHPAWMLAQFTPIVEALTQPSDPRRPTVETMAELLTQLRKGGYDQAVDDESKLNQFSERLGCLFLLAVRGDQPWQN